MARPYFDTGLCSLTRVSQRQSCVSPLGLSHASISSRGPSTGRSICASSRNAKVSPHCAAMHAAAANFPLKRSSWQQEKKHSSASGSTSPPFSLSHMQAVTLAAEDSFRLESRGILDGLMDAFERHVLHAEPSGNFRLPSNLLHVGECPEVPEHLGTFALRRSGSLHFRRQREEETEEEQETIFPNNLLRKHSKTQKPQKLAPRHVAGEARQACSCCSKQGLHAAEETGCCCDLGPAQECSTSCSSHGSGGSTSGDTPRSGGMRRTFSWQRLRDKLRR